jgi:hypothetical protein
VFFVKRFNHKDLVGMGQLSAEDIELVMETTESLKEISQREIKKIPTLRGKGVVQIFLNQARELALLLKWRQKDLVPIPSVFPQQGVAW